MPVTGSTTPARKSAVPYTILTGPGEITEQWEAGHNQTVVLCSTAWATAADFLDDMLGWPLVVGGVLQRTLPERCPYAPTQYAVKADLVRAFGNPYDPAPFASPDASVLGDNAWPDFGTAIYRVTFARPLFDVLEDPDSGGSEMSRHVIRRRKIVPQNEKWPGASYKFVNDAITADKRIPLSEVGVRTGRMIQYQMKWLEVPLTAVLETNQLACANKVNDVTFDGRYPAETVLFESMDSEPRTTARGDLVSDITYNFLVRADGRTWNKFWSRSNGGFTSVTIDGSSGGTKMFQTADLTKLFKFA